MKNVHENHFCRNKLGPSSLNTLQNDFLRNAKPKRFIKLRKMSKTLLYRIKLLHILNFMHII